MSSGKFSLINLDISNSEKTALSMITNLISFAITIGISFFLSPYIVKMLGADANGFVTLANNFVGYAQLITIALNGVGSRFVTVAYHQGDYEKSGRYFSTLFFGNVTIGIVFFLLGGIIIYELDKLLDVPVNLVNDIKLLFFFVFMNFILNTVFSPFSTPVYIKNKLYLQYVRDVQAQSIRGILLVVLFFVFSPKVFFVGLGLIVTSIICAAYNVYYKIKLVPEIKIKKEYFTVKYLKELLSQGVWNSLSSAGNMLLSGLDLLIANLFVGSGPMGILSVAKTFPGVISSLMGTLSQVFYPDMLKEYSDKNFDALANTVKKSTKLLLMICSIPTVFLIVFGSEFYSLWQPTLDAKELQILSILTCLSTLFICAGSCLSNIFTLSLQVRKNSIAVIISGVISTVVTLILVKFTNLGVYAIAGVSSVVGIIRALVYSFPKSASLIGKNKKTFYSITLNTMKCSIILSCAGFAIKQLFTLDNWFNLIAAAVVFSIISLIINMIILFNKHDRKMLIDYALCRFKIRK